MEFIGFLNQLLETKQSNTGLFYLLCFLEDKDELKSDNKNNPIFPYFVEDYILNTKEKFNRVEKHLFLINNNKNLSIQDAVNQKIQNWESTSNIKLVKNTTLKNRVTWKLSDSNYGLGSQEIYIHVFQFQNFALIEFDQQLSLKINTIIQKSKSLFLLVNYSEHHTENTERWANELLDYYYHHQYQNQELGLGAPRMMILQKVTVSSNANYFVLMNKEKMLLDQKRKMLNNYPGYKKYITYLISLPSDITFNFSKNIVLLLGNPENNLNEPENLKLSTYYLDILTSMNTQQ